MEKAGKIILIVFSVTVALLIGACIFFTALWNGAFSVVIPNEIATYNSPDGEYSLVFEQMGGPEWPFGPTEIRLTLKDHNGKIIERVSTKLNDDGANADEHNIASISWNDDAVIVILRASEMKDKEVSISYDNS